MLSLPILLSTIAGLKVVAVVSVVAAAAVAVAALTVVAVVRDGLARVAPGREDSTWAAVNRVAARLASSGGWLNGRTELGLGERRAEAEE